MKNTDASGETSVTFDGEGTIAAQRPPAERRLQLRPCLVAGKQGAPQPLRTAGLADIAA
jgi:hypothetical protein